MSFYIDNVSPRQMPLPPGITQEMAEKAIRLPNEVWSGTLEEREINYRKWLRIKARLERRMYAHHFLSQKKGRIERNERKYTRGI